MLSVSTCTGLLRSSKASKALRFASVDNCLTAGGGGLIFVGGDRERTGRALRGVFSACGGADGETTGTAGGGALRDLGVPTTGDLAIGGATGVCLKGGAFRAEGGGCGDTAGTNTGSTTNES